jgi:hypothetical protein
LQVAITESWICMSFPEIVRYKAALRLTIFRLLFIGLKAYFDLDSRDGHNLTRLHKHL